MVSATTALLAFGTVASVSATKLIANYGCIYVNGNKDGNRLCDNNGGYYVDQFTTIYACVEGTQAWCKFAGTIPGYYEEAHFGRDNCVYSIGNPAVKVGCAEPINPPEPVPNPYN